MLNYREPTPDKESYDASTHCSYCGAKIESEKEFCSKSCKAKDSVWHKDDNM
ncbi:MAG: DUF2116 family Zn-ribbon domain-containing protein [Nitrosopumilus sp.]|nr:DUF2116 family Zn-ribbon domain-containing protein [Nitrosopumilus sp.]MDH3854661.1 DUF2116 family Zn-ribbon domain-containing protein [Nitrosopumilus sp.]